jgi:carbonic anhydrase
LAFSDLKQSVIDDVEFLKKDDYVLKNIPITGYIYHVESGELEKVIEA